MKKILLSLAALLTVAGLLRADEGVPPGLVYHRVHVCEELTATWCGYCPRGQVGVDRMKEKYPDSFISIAVHGGDVMEEPTYMTALENFTTSYPNSFLNRRVWCDPYFGLEEQLRQVMSEAATTALAVSARYTDNSRSAAAVAIRSKFAFSSTEARYAYAIVVTEDEVRGSTSDYDQMNAYSGSSLEMGGYELLPPRVPASQMVYQHVARAIYPGFEGIPSSLPAVLNREEEMLFQTDISLPANILNKENLKIVALLIDEKTGEICNAAQTNVSGSTATGNSSLSVPGWKVLVYSSDRQLTVDLQTDSEQEKHIEVFRSDGKKVAERRTSADGLIPLPVNEPRGLYFVRIGDGTNVLIRKVVCP